MGDGGSVQQASEIVVISVEEGDRCDGKSIEALSGQAGVDGQILISSHKLSSKTPNNGALKTVWLLPRASNLEVCLCRTVAYSSTLAP